MPDSLGEVYWETSHVAYSGKHIDLQLNLQLNLQKYQWFSFRDGGGAKPSPTFVQKHGTISAQGMNPPGLVGMINIKSSARLQVAFQTTCRYFRFRWLYHNTGKPHQSCQLQPPPPWTLQHHHASPSTPAKPQTASKLASHWQSSASLTLPAKSTWLPTNKKQTGSQPSTLTAAYQP